MKTLKTALSLLMVFCMLLSLGTAAFADVIIADGGTTGDAVITGVNEGATYVGYTDTSGGGHSITPGSGTNSHAQDLDPTALDNNNVTGGGQTPAAGSSYPNFTYVIEEKDNSIVVTQVNPIAINVAVAGTMSDISLSLSNSDDDDEIIEVNGTICYGFELTGYKKMNAVVEGDISNSNGDTLSVADYDGRSIEVTVNGDVTATASDSAAISTDHSGSGTLDVTVNGDVSSARNGIIINTRSSGKTSISVTGDPTVTGAGSGTVTGDIVLSQRADKENTSITVWKVDGNLCQKQDDGTTTESYASEDIANLFKDVVNYIVRLVQPDSGSTDSDLLSVSATKADGSTALDKDKSNTMEIAHEGDKIKLNVNTADVGEGYVVKAYNGDKEITPDTNGNFFYEVQRGGGVLLKAIRSLIKQDDSGDDNNSTDNKPSGKPAAAVVDLSFASVKFTFDLAGGTLDGETGKVIKWFVPGATVKLPAAPTKDGFTFAGWQTKIGGEVKVFQAGDKFTVTAAQDFTALWE